MTTQEIEGWLGTPLFLVPQGPGTKIPMVKYTQETMESTKREVYRGVGEVAVYLGEKFRGRGIGKTLLGRLVEASEQTGFWTLQAVIFAKNYASIKLHESAGFRIVGVRERIAERDGVWHDNVLMEQRSEAWRQLF